MIIRVLVRGRKVFRCENLCCVNEKLPLLRNELHLVGVDLWYVWCGTTLNTVQFNSLTYFQFLKDSIEWNWNQHFFCFFFWLIWILDKMRNVYEQKSISSFPKYTRSTSSFSYVIQSSPLLSCCLSHCFGTSEILSACSSLVLGHMSSWTPSRVNEPKWPLWPPLVCVCVRSGCGYWCGSAVPYPLHTAGRWQGW